MKSQIKINNYPLDNNGPLDISFPYMMIEAYTV